MFPPIKSKLNQALNRSTTIFGSPNHVRSTSNSSKSTKGAQRSRSNQQSKVPIQLFDESKSSGMLAVLPFSCLRRILIFLIKNYVDVLQLQKICKRLFYSLMNDAEVYSQIATTMLGYPASEIREYLRQQCLEDMLNKYQIFVKKVDQLFLYGSTKLNLPDKLLDQSGFQVKATINQKLFDPKLLTRKANFATHFYVKIPLDSLICPMKDNTSQSLKISIQIYSSYLKLYLNFHHVYTVKQMLADCIRLKAYNYFVDGNVLTTFFEGDDRLLYMIFEMSAVSIIYKFMQKIITCPAWIDRHKLRENNSKAKLMFRAQRVQKIYQEQLEETQSAQMEQNDSDNESVIPFQQQQSIRKPPSIQKPPMHKSITNNKVRTPMLKLVKNKYTNLQQYLQDQQDFEVIVNIHNGKKSENLLLFIDTRALPKIHQSTLRFQYPLNEQIDMVQFHLDNNLGIKEVVNDLYLGDVVVKDRDRFVVIFSGFVQGGSIDQLQIDSQYGINNTMEFSNNCQQWNRLTIRKEKEFEVTLIYLKQGKNQAVSKLLLVDLHLNLIQQLN